MFHHSSSSRNTISSSFVLICISTKPAWENCCWISSDLDYLIRDVVFGGVSMVCAKLIQQSLCHLSHLLDCLIERCLIDFGWLAVPTDLSHELQRRSADFLLGGGNLCIP
jgi:hypothetical protein